ncbi:MAG: hypothetical protein AABY95_07675 [Pseudomonadota bacterium]
MNDSPLSFEKFGHAFIHGLVTPERVSREVKNLLADPIEGSISILPAALTAQYVFKLADAQVKARPELRPELVLRQRITGSLALSVRILGMPFRFTLQLGIRLEQHVRTYAPLILRLETLPLDQASVDIDVDAHGLPSEILDKFNLIEGAVRSEVVSQVNRRLTSGPIADATRIDVQRLAESAALPKLLAKAQVVAATTIDVAKTVTRLEPKPAV